MLLLDAAYSLLPLKKAVTISSGLRNDVHEATPDVTAAEHSGVPDESLKVIVDGLPALDVGTAPKKVMGSPIWTDAGLMFKLGTLPCATEIFSPAA